MLFSDESQHSSNGRCVKVNNNRAIAIGSERRIYGMTINK